MGWRSPLRKGLVWSLVIHGIILLVIGGGLFAPSPLPIPPSSVMTVGIVKLGPVTQAPSPIASVPQQAPHQENATAEPPPAPSPEPRPEIEPMEPVLFEPVSDKPILDSNDPDGAPKPEPLPVPNPLPTPKSPPKKENKKPPVPPKPEGKPKPKPKPKQKPKPDPDIKPKPQKKKDKAKDLSALLDTLPTETSKGSSSLDNLMTQGSSSPGAQGASVGEATITERDLIRQEIYRWWNDPLVARRTGVRVAVEIHLTPEGRVKDFQVLESLGTPSHEHYALTLETAERALKHPQLHIPLSPQRYPVWQRIKFIFEPS